MTNRETVERKIGLTFDYVNFLIDNPSIVETLPERYQLEIVEKDFPRMETAKTDKASKQAKKTVRVLNTFEEIL